MRSPFNLVQEFAAEGPDPVWRVLMVCTMLNKTHGRQVRPIIEEFFERFPTPADLLAAPESTVLDFIKPLGLYNRRLLALRGISAGIVDGLPLARLPWIGEYAKASVEIFCNHNSKVKTDDVWLQRYLDWRVNQPINGSWS